MTKHVVQLSSIEFDAGTQVRAAISESVVTEYAERMGEGVTFPPVVLFFDSTRYYMGDGFHRAQAAQRLGLAEIDADVRLGTKQDAIWFAIGANRLHGAQLTALDKQHAVQMALDIWPHKLHREIADHVGCSVSLVSKQSSKNTSATGKRVATGRAFASQVKREAVSALIEAGEKDSETIAAKAGVSKSFVSKVRAEKGLQCFDRTKAGVVKRRALMREMAAEGHTSRQIAATVGLSEEGCRSTLKSEGIEVPADRATGKLRRHDSTRIMEHVVMDAENLTADLNLVTFSDLDPSRLPDWLSSLKSSRDKLGELIRRLMKEQQKHVEAA